MLIAWAACSLMKQYWFKTWKEKVEWYARHWIQIQEFEVGHNESMIISLNPDIAVKYMYVSPITLHVLRLVFAERRVSRSPSHASSSKSSTFSNPKKVQMHEGIRVMMFLRCPSGTTVPKQYGSNLQIQIVWAIITSMLTSYLQVLHSMDLAPHTLLWTSGSTLSLMTFCAYKQKVIQAESMVIA
jgi:hypothetical protein